jgi:Flp pilus assembly protein TadG
MQHDQLSPKINRVRAVCGNLGKDRSGSIAMVYGLTAVVLMASVGAGVDAARLYNSRSHMQSAMDASVLAAGRVLQVSGDTTAAINTAARHYAELKSRQTMENNDTVSFEVTENATQVTGTGISKVNTPFMSFVGVPNFDVKVQARSGIAYGGSGDSSLEIAMMLDLTGSMCPNESIGCTTSPKLDALKTAAKDLINIAVWDNQGAVTSRVALIPFSTRIRVGADGSADGAALMKKVTNLDPTWSGYIKECVSDNGGGGGGEGAGNWECFRYANNYKTNLKVMPCVTDRSVANQKDVSDDAPGPNFWLNGHDGSRRQLSFDSRDIPLTSKRGLVANDAAEQWNYDTDGGCADVGNTNIVMPLTADKAALRNRIDGFTAYGSTSGGLGTQWAWYMLSPKWNSVWTGTAAPAPYSQLLETGASGQPKLKKIAILLSDGVYNTFRGWKEQGTADMSAYAQSVCTAMKAQGITIYSIGFGLNELPAGDRALATQTLRECSTSHTIDSIGTLAYNFYNAETGHALHSAFRDIALQLSRLRLSN